MKSRAKTKKIGKPKLSGSIPNLTVTFSYDTASELQHALLNAYVRLEKEDPKSYETIAATLDPFFKFLTRYLENPHTVAKLLNSKDAK